MVPAVLVLAIALGASRRTPPERDGTHRLGNVACVAGRAHQLFDPESPPLTEPHPDAGTHPDEPTAPADQTGTGGRPDALSIGGLYDEVEAALRGAFPRTRMLWVRGEIRSISDHRSGHLYMELIDPDHDGGGRTARGRGVPTLNVKCWRTSWAPLRHALAKEGIALAEGMVVDLRGTIDLYRAKGEVSLILVEVDVTALIGRLAAQRTQLLRKLEADGLLRRNASLPTPEVPLHVGLVGSPGTEGYQDFLGQLTESGFAFRVSVVRVRVQGPDAPASVGRAVRMLSRDGCDLIALVRGGGARADLAAFDTELVARAVAESAVPVWTGIGHTGDETVTDLVAQRRCITPTECGQAIVHVVRRWWAQRVHGPAALLARRVPSALGDAQERDRRARRAVAAASRHQLAVHHERVRARTSTLGRTAPGLVEAAEARVRIHAARLGPLSVGHLGRQEERTLSWRRLLAAYDVDRQLERGYSLTTTAEGALVRSAAEVVPEQQIVTRFADGTVRSTVEGSDMRHKEED
jgi:exodeoxyribonuclease VII large subunit